ncbi:helix-turn-helix transcriptional regulator [Streptomyces sp. SID9727]|uniref:helix-turn-helix domain-containing protein n=1 Tax=Streptomyces sp. SID9727 TaxID=2706114 RepID=UPI0031BAD53D
MATVGGGRSSLRPEDHFGRAVRDRRRAAGMTQSRLAELAGMSQAAISRLEHGKCMPTFYLLEKIAEALNSVLVVAIGPGRRVAVEFRNGPERAGAAG